MDDKQKNIIDKLNKDNESLNQGHKSMVEYSKGMIYIGSLIIDYMFLDLLFYEVYISIWVLAL